MAGRSMTEAGRMEADRAGTVTSLSEEPLLATHSSAKSKGGGGTKMAAGGPLHVAWKPRAVNEGACSKNITEFFAAYKFNLQAITVDGTGFGKVPKIYYVVL